MSLLQVEKLNAGYGKKNIINDISLELEEGELIGILGPNGSGKSTLIKALCKGIPYKGNITLGDRNLKEMSEKELAKICSYVPQNSGLSIDISALEVVLMGFYPYLGLLEGPDRKMKEKARDILFYVGLEKEVQSNYMELSEGQKRICILARSFVADSKMLLLDEPDASLDFGIRNRILKIIEEKIQENKSGALLSLHDTNLALAYCDKIYLMKNGKICGTLYPKEDSLLKLELELQRIYGKIKLLEYNNESGIKKLVMVQA